MLLSSPLVWLQYYLLLLPLLLYVVSANYKIGASDPDQVSPPWRSALLFLPYLPLFFFSLLFHMVVGTNLRLLCIFVILAIVLTLTLATLRIRRARLYPLLPFETQPSVSAGFSLLGPGHAPGFRAK